MPVGARGHGREPRQPRRSLTPWAIRSPNSGSAARKWAMLRSTMPSPIGPDDTERQASGDVVDQAGLGIGRLQPVEVAGLGEVVGVPAVPLVGAGRRRCTSSGAA